MRLEKVLTRDPHSSSYDFRVASRSGASDVRVTASMSVDRTYDEDAVSVMAFSPVAERGKVEKERERERPGSEWVEVEGRKKEGWMALIEHRRESNCPTCIPLSTHIIYIIYKFTLRDTSGSILSSPWSFMS